MENHFPMLPVIPVPVIPPEAGAAVPEVKPVAKKPKKPKAKPKKKAAGDLKRKDPSAKAKATVKRRKKAAAPSTSEPPEAFQKMPVAQLKKIATDMGLPWVAGKEGIRGTRELLEARTLGVERTWELISCDDEMATLDVVVNDPNNEIFQAEGKAWIELSLEFGHGNIDRFVQHQRKMKIFLHQVFFLHFFSFPSFPLLSIGLAVACTCETRHTGGH